jgi:DNA repair exonuclease SbcCD ATPase subunit
MTNDNKNINELVISDDDSTVELETLVLQQSFVDEDSHCAADGANDDAMSGQESNQHLQFDILKKLQNELSSKTELLEQQAGRLASDEIEIQELNERFVQAEKYADRLRQQLQDREIVIETAADNRELLQRSVDWANERISTLITAVSEAEANCEKMSEELASLHKTHAEEVRMIRLELGDAQDTMSQNEMITEQLASDLDETRVYRVELERMLSKSEDTSQSRIELLEDENRDLRRESGQLTDKLGTSSESINCLLAELAKKSRQIESTEAIEDVIHEIDDRISEQIDEYVPTERDRVTRLLIGSVKGKALRFPLFKNRLTIGRSRQNDIQLKGSCISRRHAVVITEGDQTRVIDWGSKNGVAVNSKPVTEHFLKNGDLVTVGNAEFRYEERRKRDKESSPR